MALDRHLWVGAANPNWRNAAAKVCEHCSSAYRSYAKSRRFCSRKCFAAFKIARPRVPKVRASRALHRRPGTAPRKSNRAGHFDLSIVQGRVRARKAGQNVPLLKTANGASPLPNFVCLECAAPFHAYAKRRIYCSYACHLKSGGAKRAGMASQRAVMRYGVKKDANHIEIVAALRRCGIGILDISSVGCGAPDLVVYVPALGRVLLVEIKNKKTGYGRRGLNENQKEWAASWNGPEVIVLTSYEQAPDLAAGRLELLKGKTSG